MSYSLQMRSPESLKKFNDGRRREIGQCSRRAAAAPEVDVDCDAEFYRPSMPRSKRPHRSSPTIFPRRARFRRPSGRAIEVTWQPTQPASPALD